MCGITGYAQFSGAAADQLRDIVRRMSGTLVHRGPDDEGEWIDSQCGVALGFRRLSIIDVSEAGHQPMVSRSGRFVIVFNGEVYNFQELRNQLLPHGHVFRGHSDTEVLLAAFEEWGIQAAVRRFVGMFAIALWDRSDRRLYLIRDRLGIKPLYYGWAEQTFLFGSELRALRAFPRFNAEVNTNALMLFIRHSCVPQPYSIFEGTSKLPPGTILSIAHDKQVTIEPYWSVRETFEAAAAKPFSGENEEAIDELHDLLSNAVGMRMVSDVPLGAFLSGGIDSSTVVALMQAQSNRPVKTFSIGFEEGDFNEAPHAKQVAAHLGTEHNELYVTSEEVMAVLPKLPIIYDEPFSDSSQIPTYLVSALARSEVAVSLTGDGGDEVFAGYTRYAESLRKWHAARVGPKPLRHSLSWAISLLSDEQIEIASRAAMALFPSDRRITYPLQRARTLQQMLKAERPFEYYRRVVSRTSEPQRFIDHGHEELTGLTDEKGWPRVDNFLTWMMAIDLVTYLPDDILTKVDRASMAVSLEARVPLLDHRVVEFAASLPLQMKMRGKTAKWILRQVLHRYVPARLIERPKMGFAVPITAWLRGPLRDWAEALLSESRLRRDGYFNVAEIRREWSNLLRLKSENDAPLWEVLMFQAWLDEWNSSKRSQYVAGDPSVPCAIRSTTVPDESL